MSSTRLPPATDLDIGSSRWLVFGCAVAYVAAIGAVFPSGLVWPLRIALALVLLAFAVWWIIARALLLAPHSIIRFVWRSDGECEWLERRGRWRRGELLPGTLVTPAVVVLRLRMGRLRSRTLCITSDAANSQAFRRLRMRLIVSPPPMPPALSRRIARRVRSGLKRSAVVDDRGLRGRRRMEP